jgi:FkbM family methyltransferase
MAESAPAKMVRRGDYVLDCGAHVGIFTHQALQLGARTVVAIEPEPVNRECLRRNFREEIASGRVIVVPKGVWSSHGVLTLSLGVDNSGANTGVLPGGSGAIQIPVTTIDDLVRDLTIPRVDYIKMDIEGAEREALRGAAATLRTFRPRVLAENHRPDDMLVLPGLLRQAHASYAAVCGPCVIQRGLLVPHVVFYD